MHTPGACMQCAWETQTMRMCILSFGVWWWKTVQRWRPGWITIPATPIEDRLRCDPPKALRMELSHHYPQQSKPQGSTIRRQQRLPTRLTLPQSRPFRGPPRWRAAAVRSFLLPLCVLRTLAQPCATRPPRATLIHCSVKQTPSPLTGEAASFFPGVPNVQ